MKSASHNGFGTVRGSYPGTPSPGTPASRRPGKGEAPVGTTMPAGRRRTQGRSPLAKTPAVHMPLARVPLHAGGGGIAATALAFLAALLLAPEAARAAQECGGPQLSTLTCSMTSYSDGIYYGGSANEVYGTGGTTLNIAGSGTATTTITAGGTQAVGVHVDTLAGQNRPFTLNIGGATGGTAHVVNIVQGTNTNTDTDRNNGVYILDQGQFSGTTVDLKRGVTIGSETTPMKQHGIQVRLDGSGLVGTGESTITSAATIFAAKRGIWVRRNPGTTTATNSATTITNSGDITSGEHGIYLDYSAATSNAHTRGATITNTGAIMVSGVANNGIFMNYRSLGDAKITNRGDITANAANSNGIFMSHTGSAGGATIINSGDITSHALAISVKTSKKIAAGTTADASVIHEGGAIDVSNQAGILVAVGEEDDTTANNAGTAEIRVMGGSVKARDEALLARNRQAGNVVINVSEGVTLTSRTGEGILGDLPASNEKGGVAITNAAAITSAKVGILVRRTAPANAGNISITNHGAIKRTGDQADFAGIRVEDDRGKGHVTVTNSGDIGEAGAMAMHLHGIQVQKTGSSGDLSVTTTGGSITAKDRGIYVTDNAGHTGAVTISNGGDITADRPIYVNRGGEGPVTITNTGGTVRTESSHAIFAWNKTGDASDVRVNVEGGTVQSSRSALNFAHVNVVHAFNRGTGDVIVDVADGALISRVSEAVYANLDSTTLAPDNQVKITQGGRMMGRTGVYARAGGYSVAAEGEEVAARAEGNPDVIDVTWTGSFSHGTTEAEKAMVAQNDEGRFSAANVSDLVVFSQYIEAERATDGLYGSAAGVEAAVMPRRIADSTGILQVVAAGDVPGEFPDAAAQTALLAETGDASRRTAILAQFRAMLGNEEIDAASVLTAIDSTATTVADLSDEEILDYLGADTSAARNNLLNVLFGLSEAEKAILRAVATGGDVDAALRAAGFTDDPDDDEDYWSRVKALLNRYNPGNIRVAMNGGSIDSRGDGIRAYYATPHANNGAINVTVAEGAEVTGAVAGIRVANAGLGNVSHESDWARYLRLGSDAEDVRQQFVTVNGMVTGGTDAAVHLVGGGMLLVGETGEVRAGSSGVGVLVNDPGDAYVTIHGLVQGGKGGAGAVHLTGGGGVAVGPTGRVMANGADRAIRTDDPTTPVVVFVPGNTAVTGNVSREAVESLRARVTGALPTQTRWGVTDDKGPTGGLREELLLGDDGNIALNPEDYQWAPCLEGHTRGEDGMCRMDEKEPPRQPPRQPSPTFDCKVAAMVNDRCRLYEALPSTLLAMNGLPTYEERMSAARDAKGGWARVEAARGKWKADTSTRPDVAYDHSRSGVHAGMDFAVGDAGRAGLSFHGLRGSAEMAGVGEVDLSGSGLGVHGTTGFAGGFLVDAQAAVTWYDVDLKSAVRGSLKNDVSGRGYALGVEVGKRLPAMDGGVTVTPRAGLRWSKAGLDDFVEEVMDGARVSVKDAQSLKGRAGVGVEKVLDEAGMDGSRLFASLDVEQEFKEETEAMVSETSLKASAKKTRFRAAAGGARVWGEGRYALQGSLGYAAGGGDNRDFGGGLSFAIRF